VAWTSLSRFGIKVFSSFGNIFPGIAIKIKIRIVQSNAGVCLERSF
jgi:hypothetical protein